MKRIAIQRRCRNCRKIYKPTKKSKGNLCSDCRYERYTKKFQQAHPEIQRERVARSDALHRPMKYGAWLAWVEKNKDKRRAIALKSYHRRKVAKQHDKPRSYLEMGQSS